MTDNTMITVARGDGIGPEIMDATLAILHAAGAAIEPVMIDVGEKVYLSGNSCGIEDAAWDKMKQSKVLLKAPITTPQGGGYKSVNVTIRKSFGLFANVRPCRAYYPHVPSDFPDMDLVIVRENEEGLYAGIEHRLTPQVCQTLKLFSADGCYRIIRYAFEYAKQFNRRKVTCMSKDNIMKLTDGMFHKIFDDVAKEYPGFETEHLIIDIGTAMIASRPQRFDVVVTSNLYGDIISDVAAQVAGSVGLAGSANIGADLAMFEAVHGSAPDIAGQDIANPSGLLNGAVQMLIHIGQPEVAARVQNAWLATIEQGIHTKDIYNPAHSKQCVGTKAFAEAVIERLGSLPEQFPKVSYQQSARVEIGAEQDSGPVTAKQKQCVGVDIFLDATVEKEAIDAFCQKLAKLDSPLQLVVINNRGLKVWPEGRCEGYVSDLWCCRYQASAEFAPVTAEQLIAQIDALVKAGFDVVKTENLYLYDGVRGFSLAQGQ